MVLVCIRYLGYFSSAVSSSGMMSCASMNSSIILSTLPEVFGLPTIIFPISILVYAVL